MSAPRSIQRRRSPRRTVRVLGKEYRDIAYVPQFALGIPCSDEREQQAIHRKLTKVLPGKEIKVLVI